MLIQVHLDNLTFKPVPFSAPADQKDTEPVCLAFKACAAIRNDHNLSLYMSHVSNQRTFDPRGVLSGWGCAKRLKSHNLWGHTYLFSSKQGVTPGLEPANSNSVVLNPRYFELNPISLGFALQLSPLFETDFCWPRPKINPVYFD